MSHRRAAFAAIGDQRQVVRQDTHRAAVAAGDTAAPALQHAEHWRSARSRRVLSAEVNVALVVCMSILTKSVAVKE